ncbi:ring-1,2-phenylacetyl-CoA epoxidase subunit PaaC [Halopolyspora algeriensis]|uniref:Ring-1,2-phenylacetyl-CoA epoxidase subunit PaaC n=1 Tax=Halopolyspora algeriensis TaxID=1500506 RepID=A0A368W0X6_9ACTN|nr:1,2-phenylacetyl-CoA epoxidase subunit PaaC [Halopolyspora algeriensis]RCW46874.1 ring-1,2-phenylacetyl-CoA epoxidase subunit PaaC [Halopolyspora algeriensis]TQM47965.1 ring-1,2-phenylacetyl-CoA epoxidase subunit PaaC [Halopolyspora algeriensis]
MSSSSADAHSGSDVAPPGGTETQGEAETPTQRWVLGPAPRDPMLAVPRYVPEGVSGVDLSCYCLMLADDALVLSQRLAEVAYRAPELEEHVALAEIGLDLLRQARTLLGRAGELDEDGRDEDRLAHFRVADQFRNVRLVEIDCGPGAGGDFSAGIARFLLFAVWRVELFRRLADTRDPVLSALAANWLPRSIEHRDHAAQWVIRLGDATEVSRQHILAGLSRVWPLAGELFAPHPVEMRLTEVACAVDPSALLEESLSFLDQVMSVARLESLDVRELDYAVPPGGRDGVHTEALQFLLAEMQYIARSEAASGW